MRLCVKKYTNGQSDKFRVEKKRYIWHEYHLVNTVIRLL